jgi:hypothetical protein
MASEKPTIDSNALFMAQSIVNGAENMLKGTTGAQRDALLTVIQQAQDTIDAYNQQKTSGQNADKVKSLGADVEKLYNKRDVAKISKKSDLKSLDKQIYDKSEQIKKLGGTAKDYPTDFTYTKSSTGDGSSSNPQAIPAGATIQTNAKTGTKNVVDSNNTIIGTTKDGKTYLPGFLGNTLKSEVPATTGGNNGKSVTADGTFNNPSTVDMKAAYTGYLKQTFATLEDKTQKAEIDALLKTAKAQNWTATEWQSHLEGTSWWQQTAPTLRQFYIDSHDPRKASEFAQSLTNKVDSIATKLEALGIYPHATDPVTGAYVDNSKMMQGIAMDAMKNGWTDAQLAENLSTRSDILFSGGGQIGNYLDQIKSKANLYGVTLDSTKIADINRALLNPNDGRDYQYFLTDVKNQAFNNPMYKPFADIMKSNNTDLYSVTSSYRQQMAKTLEVDPTAITWNDLMGKVVDSNTGNARTFSDFTKELRKDPLWQKTQNAKETYSGMALDLMKMFGFVG